MFVNRGALEAEDRDQHGGKEGQARHQRQPRETEGGAAFEAKDDPSGAGKHQRPPRCKCRSEANKA